MDALPYFADLKRFHIETGDDKEWGILYTNLLETPNAPYTTFIKLGYFRQCQNAVQRFQDIPDQYKITRSSVRLFLSHKWETREHPDPSRRTLNALLNHTRHCDDNAGVWWDYCSLPQKNSADGNDDRSAELKDFFKFQLSLIPLVIMDSQCMFLWSADGMNSGWCCVELLIAQTLLQHLNRMIYTRKDKFINPPLFVTQVGNKTLVDSDLLRFDHTIVNKMYCTEAAMERHNELIAWMNTELCKGEPIQYTQLTKKMTIELISKMISKHGLTFTHKADYEVVSKMLHTIYQRLSFEPFDSFKWTGSVDFWSILHYVRGCMGTCLVPKFAYWF